MKSHKMLRTITIINPSELENRVGQETLAICGAPRGMTSTVAFCMYEMEYFIGYNLGSKNYEDQEFLNAIPPSKWMKKRLMKRGVFLDLVAKRNSSFSRWGFKLPHASEHIPDLIKTLRDPVFVVCVRNPLSVAGSVSKREPNSKHNLTGLLNVGRSYFQAIDVLLAEKDTPSILVNMDMVQQHPGVFLEEFTGALHLNGNLLEIKNKISKKGYKESVPRNEITFKKQ